MDYEQLYALWERQNWRSHELDFSVDKEHWLATPTEAQQHTAFSLGSFYVGEERVTADLAPFLLAAPSGEIEAFLATQLVDEMRHAVFFDRWMAEVMGLEADDMRAPPEGDRGEHATLGPGGSSSTTRCATSPTGSRPSPTTSSCSSRASSPTTWSPRGCWRCPGQRIIIQYTERPRVYPGFNKGFRLVEQDEHRHIAFGVRFLKDVCEERPEMKKVIVDGSRSCCRRRPRSSARPRPTTPPTSPPTATTPRRSTASPTRRLTAA